MGVQGWEFRVRGSGSGVRGDAEGARRGCSMGAEQGEGVFRHTSVGLGGGRRLRHWRASSGGCREAHD